MPLNFRSTTFFPVFLTGAIQCRIQERKYLQWGSCPGEDRGGRRGEGKNNERYGMIKQKAHGAKGQRHCTEAKWDRELGLQMRASTAVYFLPRFLISRVTRYPPSCAGISPLCLTFMFRFIVFLFVLSFFFISTFFTYHDVCVSFVGRRSAVVGHVIPRFSRINRRFWGAFRACTKRSGYDYVYIQKRKLGLKCRINLMEDESGLINRSLC